MVAAVEYVSDLSAADADVLYGDDHSFMQSSPGIYFNKRPS